MSKNELGQKQVDCIYDLVVNMGLTHLEVADLFDLGDAGVVRLIVQLEEQARTSPTRS